MKNNKKSVIVFLIITLVLSCICYYLRIAGGDKARGMIEILMWCPGVTALIVARKYYKGQNVLRFNTCSKKYILAAIYLPIIYLGISYGIFWIFNKESFTGKLYSDSFLTLILLIPSSLINASGEEIGWRGFLLPKLTEIYNVKVAILITGFIWGIWHLPIMIAGLYQPGAIIWYKIPIFIIDAIIMTGILAYLTLKSKSVFPAIILHSAHNYINDLICRPLTKSPMEAYFVGETGVITVITMLIVAIVLLQISKNSPKEDENYCSEDSKI